ncbi:MAG: hypothetical protein ABI688_08705, partial [Bacteroidota bacterium]
GIGVTTAIIVNKKSPGKEVVKGTGPGGKTNIEIPVVIPGKSNSPVNENAVADNDIKITSPVIKEKETSNNAIAKEKKDQLKLPAPVQITTQPVKEEPVVATNNNDKKTNELPKPLNNPNINKKDAGNDAVARKNPARENNQQKSLTDPVVTIEPTPPSEIRTASLVELDQPDDKKNKSRGFFRKIARTFEKRTDIDPTDDNKLLVGGLAIRLK